MRLCKCEACDRNYLTDRAFLVCPLIVDLAVLESPSTSRIGSAVIGEDEKKLTILKLGPCYCCVVILCVMRCLCCCVVCPVTHICCIVDLYESAVLVKYKCCTKAVSCKCTCVILVICDYTVLGSCCCFYCCVVEPFVCCYCKCVCAKLNYYASALLCTYCLCALFICALATCCTYALTCVAVSCTLLCASCFCAFCIKALATCLTLAFALVSVSFTLFSAYCICAVACALTALFALVSALVRSFLKCKSGNGDNFTN